MYLNKRAIPWAPVPAAEIEIPQATDRQKVYTWWPVAIMNIKPVALGLKELQDYRYVICVYQAMWGKPVAWGMKISKMVNLPFIKDS